MKKIVERVEQVKKSDFPEDDVYVDNLPPIGSPCYEEWGQSSFFTCFERQEEARSWQRAIWDLPKVWGKHSSPWFTLRIFQNMLNFFKTCAKTKKY